MNNKKVVRIDKRLLQFIEVPKKDVRSPVAKGEWSLETSLSPSRWSKGRKSGDHPHQIIEVQNGNYVEEEDVERFDDDYQRRWKGINSKKFSFKLLKTIDWYMNR